MLSLRPILLRCHSVRHSSSSAVQKWITHVTTSPPTVAHDTIDLRRAIQLHNTLPPSTDPFPTPGGELVRGGHLVYFQPTNRIEELGPDGSSRDTSPPEPYVRRMWAGGEFHYPASGKPITIGAELEEQTRIVKVEEKSGMLFSYEEKVLSEKGEEVLREIRCRVFQPLEDPNAPPRVSKSKPPTLPPPQFSISLTPTTPLLFRFSALTFNAHRIHYDLPHTLSAESHPALVLHGPLSALMLASLVQRNLPPGKRMASFEYRATGAMYVGKGEVLYEGALGEGGVRVWAGQAGVVGMVGKAVLVDV